MRKYKIPYTLDTNILDAQAPLSFNKDGSSTSNKEITLRTMFVVFGGVILGFWIVQGKMFLGKGSILGTIIFLLGYALALRTVFKATKIPSSLNYRRVITYWQNVLLRANKRDRIITTVFGEYDSVANITGFTEPDLDSNLHNFANGDVGRVRRIIGSASNNIFDSDRENIVKDYMTFLRSLDSNVTYNFITVLANQRVYSQLRALNNQKALEKNISIIKMIDEDIKDLEKIAEKSYKSLHQYLLLRSSDIDNLTNAETLLDNFASRSSGAISSAYHEDMDHQIATLKSIFGTTSVDDSLLLEKGEH